MLVVMPSIHFPEAFPKSCFSADFPALCRIRYSGMFCKSYSAVLSSQSLQKVILHNIGRTSGMAEMLETLLKTPPLATAEQIMIQAGKPAVFMNAQGAQQAVGSPIAAADAEAMIMSVVPANVKVAMATQPGV